MKIHIRKYNKHFSIVPTPREYISSGILAALAYKGIKGVTSATLDISEGQQQYVYPAVQYKIIEIALIESK